MNCRELDYLLERSAPPAEWPAEARQHLAECDRCRALQYAFSSISSVGLPKNVIDSVTQQVVSNLTPVQPPRPLQMNVLLIALITAGVGAVLAAATGAKGWIALSNVQRAGIFLAAAIAVHLQSTLAALELEPGRSRPLAVQFTRWLVPGVFAIAAFILFPWAPDETFLVHALPCFGRATATSALALVIVYFVARRGYFVDSRRAGSAFGLLAGLGGFVSQELYCTVLETAHVAAAHVGLLLASSFAGFLIGAIVERRRALMTTGLLAVLMLLITGSRLSAGDANPPAPVLAELFTSEGCSSCPPADKLLEKLDTAQPVPGVQIVVLSEHVDYWDGLGWKDRFSSSAFTARQETYGRRFRVESVYTPQMVIDGREQVLGNDAKAVQAAISRAASASRLPLVISDARQEGGSARFHLEVPAVPTTADYDHAEVWIAIADERSATDVAKGENSGRQLTHVAVARRLTKVGEVTKHRGFSQNLKLPAGAGPSRIVAVVQLPDTGPIAGVSMAKF